MRTGKVKIIGGRGGQQPLTGQDIRVVMEMPDGEEVLIPALSLVLSVGSRHEQAVATVEVPAVLVDLHGVELRTEAVVVPGGPESQWEESIGLRPGDRIADAEQYTEAHRIIGQILSDDLRTDHLPVQIIEGEGSSWKDIAPIDPDPMAELDAVIADGGRVENIRPRGPESLYEYEKTTTRPGDMFTGVVKNHP